MEEKQGLDTMDEIVMVRRNGVTVWIGGDEDAGD